MRIAWSGLGNMGEPMAGRLAAAGHDVKGFDLKPDARERAEALNITFAETAAADDTDFLFPKTPVFFCRQCRFVSGVAKHYPPPAGGNSESVSSSLIS